MIETCIDVSIALEVSKTIHSAFDYTLVPAPGVLLVFRDPSVVKLSLYTKCRLSHSFPSLDD